MTEQAENSCLKYCKGACCINVALFNITPGELALFSKIVRKPTADDVLDAVFQIPARDGVYVATNGSGMNIVGIKGNCPNLLPSGECGIYDERPEACRNLVVGGQDCRSARRKAGLGPLERIKPDNPHY